MSNEDYLKLIRKRSLWPMAEYRVQFSLDGRLMPKGFIIPNKSNITKALEEKHWNMKLALRRATPQSRRATREIGWSVRDRFLICSDVPFYDVFREHLVTWCRERPMLCGRRYDYLFDKGTHRPSLWLFSSSKKMSRGDFLAHLGSFGDVPATKLGDRIGLAFSETKPLIQLDMDQIVPIEEVVANGYQFSDGCGVMGKLLNMLSKPLSNVLYVDKTKDYNFDHNHRL